MHMDLPIAVSCFSGESIQGMFEELVVQLLEAEDVLERSQLVSELTESVLHDRALKALVLSVRGVLLMRARVLGSDVHIQSRPLLRFVFGELRALAAAGEDVADMQRWEQLR